MTMPDAGRRKADAPVSQYCHTYRGVRIPMCWGAVTRNQCTCPTSVADLRDVVRELTADVDRLRVTVLALAGQRFTARSCDEREEQTCPAPPTRPARRATKTTGGTDAVG